MIPFDKATNLVTAGWLLYLVSLVWVLALRGSEEAAPAAVGALIVLGMVAWTRTRGSRSALLTSTVLGSLLLLQSVGYLVSDVADDSLSIAYPLVDAVALAAAVAVIVGSVWALRTRASSASPAPAST